MDNQALSFPEVQSICWIEDRLIDWISGGMSLDLDGTITRATVSYAYPFDSAVQTPCGRYAVIYQRCGTKGLVLNNGIVVRELNRSYYFADAYEYPIALYIDCNDEPILAHCPDDYNVLVLEHLISGKQLHSSEFRNSPDYFHSRFNVSADSSLLISAGWYWHPFESVNVYDISEPLKNISQLDEKLLLPDIDGEISSADFINNSKILICTSEESLDGEFRNPHSIGPNSISTVNIRTGEIDSSVNIEETLGTVHALDEEHFLCFYKHPKLYSISTGKLIHCWANIPSGEQTGSILSNQMLPPAIAVDRKNQRFAVVDKDCVHVVTNILTD